MLVCMMERGAVADMVFWDAKSGRVCQDSPGGSKKESGEGVLGRTGSKEV